MQNYLYYWEYLLNKIIGNRSRGGTEGFLFSSYYTEM